MKFRRRGMIPGVVFLAGAIGAAGTGCSADIFDVSVALAPQQFPIDFGMANGSVPTVACDAQNTAVCGTGNSQVIDVLNASGQAEIRVACDTGLARCYAVADARVKYPVDVLQDESFTSKVGRRAVTVVRMLDITYTVPANTTTFPIPQIDVYAGPEGAASPADAGVHKVDSIGSLPAGSVVGPSEPRHLTVTDGSAARNLIESSIRGKTPFVFILTFAPRLESGAPLPSGRLQVDVQALLGLGLR